MISAVRRRRSEEIDNLEGKEEIAMKTKVLDVMSSYGIKKHRLAEWIGYTISVSRN